MRVYLNIISTGNIHPKTILTLYDPEAFEQLYMTQELESTLYYSYTTHEIKHSANRRHRHKNPHKSRQLK